MSRTEFLWIKWAIADDLQMSALSANPSNHGMFSLQESKKNAKYIFIIYNCFFILITKMISEKHYKVAHIVIIIVWFHDLDLVSHGFTC